MRDFRESSGQPFFDHHRRLRITVGEAPAPNMAGEAPARVGPQRRERDGAGNPLGMPWLCGLVYIFKHAHF